MVAVVFQTPSFAQVLSADAFSLTNTPHFANPNTTCNGSAIHYATVDAGGIGTSTYGQLCGDTIGRNLNLPPKDPARMDPVANNNFGVITNTLQPGGFFGPDPGARTLSLAAKLIF
jgi:hypothetical protein